VGICWKNPTLPDQADQICAQHFMDKAHGFVRPDSFVMKTSLILLIIVEMLKCFTEPDPVTYNGVKT